MHLATSHGDVPRIHRLVDRGKDFDEIHVGGGDFDGFGTALHVAVWRKQPAALAALSKRGANTDILDEGSVNIRMEDTPICPCGATWVPRYGQNGMGLGRTQAKISGRFSFIPDRV